MRYFTFKNRPAFTMIELVFVIIILGILASLALPRISEDHRQEAADKILSDIRYTQHLALIDNKHNFNNPRWQKAFWRIGFENCENNSGLYEYIGSDTNYQGAIDDNESARDPINGKKMIWSGADCSNGGDGTSSEDIFITKKYHITAVTWGVGCTGNSQYIGFDHLGRIHRRFAGINGALIPNYSTYLNSRCSITFTLSTNETFTIHIEPETGYAFIENQENS